MYAARLRRYGPADTLTVIETATPTPRADELLIAVSAAGVSTADWRIRASAFPAYAWLAGRLMFGLFRPRNPVPGHDFAGRVVAMGRDVSGYRLGQRVVGVAPHGAHAEYLTIKAEAAVLPIPDGLDEAGAAALPFGGLAALIFLRDVAGLSPGQRILIAGATGGVGAYAVQIARHMGAEVTALARPDRRDLVLSLGADRVIDHTAGDYWRGGDRYDVVLDTAGVTRWRHVRRVLARGGRFVPLEFGLAEIWRSLTGRFRRVKTRVAVSGDSRADLETLLALVRDGAVRPVIDSRYPLDRIAEAHRRVEGRHKTGAVILTMQDAAPARQAA